MNDEDFMSKTELPPPESASMRLRAFEDKVLGEDHPRHAGKPEMGSGSKFANPEIMTGQHRAHHAALASALQRVVDTDPDNIPAEPEA